MRFKYLEILGRGILDYLEEAGKLSKLLGQVFYWIWRKPSEWKNTMYQMVQIGVNSIPVVALTSVSTGMVLALQTGSYIRKKNGWLNAIYWWNGFYITMQRIRVLCLLLL